MSLAIPPLPGDWPFAPRTALPPWETRTIESLGSLGESWRLRVAQGTAIETEETLLSGAFGRGGVRRLGELVVRPYRRGGLVRFLVRSSYASPRRFEREWLIHRALWEAGFPTVRPMGYGWRRQGLLFEGVYLTAFQEGSPWPADWAAGAARMQELARAIEALDAWGLWAPDLNATNVLLAENGVVLLDWDRSAFVRARSLLPLYRRRMLRSLTRLGAPDAIRAPFLSALKEQGRGGR